MEQPVGPAAPPQLLPFPRRALKLLPTRGLSVAAFRAQRSPGRVSYSFWASASPRVNVAALQPARLWVRLGSGAFPLGLGWLAVRLPPRRPGWASVAVAEPEAAGSRGAWSSPRARTRWPASLLPEALVLLGEEAKGGVVAPERCGQRVVAGTLQRHLSFLFLPVYLRCTGGEVGATSALAPKIGPLGLVSHFRGGAFLTWGEQICSACHLALAHFHPGPDLAFAELPRGAVGKSYVKNEPGTRKQ